MNKYLLQSSFLLFVLLLVNFGTARIVNDLSDADNELSERDLDDSLLEEKYANEFYKRLLHPFSSKNEEVKREVKEVYEEKCENVVPTKRFCPQISQWQAFKNYENGE